MKGDLLWVYEGLTNYLGEVLAPRSGLWSPEDYRESLAETAAELDNKYGRTWRPLEDTAVAAQVLYDAGSDYQSLRRSVDYYAEGTLIWLEADVDHPPVEQGHEIARRFLPGVPRRPERPPALKPYNFDDVVAALNAVQPTTGPASSTSACTPPTPTRRSAASSAPAGSSPTTACAAISGRPTRTPARSPISPTPSAS
jgi:predicted metalloprotease with PDZ domain